jgi:phosphopantothenoylcysteine decarboxylase/phosphopantothenate--cysteine ligase
MCDVDTISRHIVASARPPVFDGVRILISSGPTAEPIDPVRVITNRSSGKTGHALAAEAMAMGADVTVVHGPSAVPPPPGARCVPVGTAAEMAAAMNERFDSTDICIMAAAVCDFRPVSKSDAKLARTGGGRSVRFTATADIAAGLGARKRSQFLVGFALENGLDTVRAARKMREKRCDMMVCNDARTAPGSDTNAIIILRPGARPEKLALMDKRDAARIILQRIAAVRGKRDD